MASNREHVVSNEVYHAVSIVVYRAVSNEVYRAVSYEVDHAVAYGEIGMDLSGSVNYPPASFCAHGNGPPSSLNGVEFLEDLRN